MCMCSNTVSVIILYCKYILKKIKIKGGRKEERHPPEPSQLVNRLYNCLRNRVSLCCPGWPTSSQLKWFFHFCLHSWQHKPVRSQLCRTFSQEIKHSSALQKSHFYYCHTADVSFLTLLEVETMVIAPQLLIGFHQIILIPSLSGHEICLIYHLDLFFAAPPPTSIPSS